jgi:hypothetical protein
VDLMSNDNELIWLDHWSAPRRRWTPEEREAYRKHKAQLKAIVAYINEGRRRLDLELPTILHDTDPLGSRERAQARMQWIAEWTARAPEDIAWFWTAEREPVAAAELASKAPRDARCAHRGASSREAHRSRSTAYPQDETLPTLSWAETRSLTPEQVAERRRLRDRIRKRRRDPT